MGRKRKLKRRNIFIDNDPTKRQKYIQKRLELNVHRARRAGKRSHIDCMKLWVNDKEYEWDEDTGQLEERTTEGSDRGNPEENRNKPRSLLRRQKGGRLKKRVKRSIRKEYIMQGMSGNMTYSQ